MAGETRKAYTAYRRLRGFGIYESEEIQERLALAEPFPQKLVRRFWPAGKLFALRLTDPKFLPSLLRCRG